MELFSSEFFSALLAIVIIDLVYILGNAVMRRNSYFRWTGAGIILLPIVDANVVQLYAAHDHEERVPFSAFKCGPKASESSD